MSRPMLTAPGGVIGVIGLVVMLDVGAPAPVRAQTPGDTAAKAPAAAKKPSTASTRSPSKRTPWGDPDLQGTWDYRTITPLERPTRTWATASFSPTPKPTQLEARAAKRLDEPPDADVPANTIHAPYWTDPGRRVQGDKRTSLIIDPPDGRLPPLTPDGQMRLATRGRGGTGGREGGKADGPEDRSTLERCITQGLPTSNLPTLYNNNVAIYQAPGYVALVHEMVHETRIVPLDGRAPLSPSIRQWEGSSRGHWDGDTLVVETTNFSRQVELSRIGSGDAPDRALHASRRQDGRRGDHGRGSRHVGEAVDRGPDDAPERRADLRVRLPRGEYGPQRHSRSRAR